MSGWVLSRTTDILFALLVMVAVLWFLLTQPYFSLNRFSPPQIEISRKSMEERLREVMAIPAERTERKARFDAVSVYLKQRLAAAGVVEQIDRGDDLRIFRVKSGKGSKRRLVMGMHLVVTEKALLPVAETTVSLVELARHIATTESVGRQLDLTIFVHQRDSLANGLIDASIFHADQLAAQGGEYDFGLLFAPGLNVPGAVYATHHWSYFDYLLPSDSSDLSIFGRLRDAGQLRQLKRELNRVGLSWVNSLSIPASMPGLRDSPLKFYWDKELPMLLVRPNILFNDQDYSGHVNFIASLAGLLNQGEP